MHLIPASLRCLEALVAGNLPAAELELGLAFDAAIWPDDFEMREGLAVHLGACLQNPRDLLWRVFMIVTGPGVVVGHAGFKGGPGRNGEVEIYWCVEPRWRGKGIARSAAAGLCAYAFDSAAVAAVTATIARSNVASQRVALALGMGPVNGEFRHGLPLWRVMRGRWRPAVSGPYDPVQVMRHVHPPVQ